MCVSTCVCVSMYETSCSLSLSMDINDAGDQQACVFENMSVCVYVCVYVYVCVSECLYVCVCVF